MPACAMGSSGLQRNRRCRRNIIFNILRRVPPVRNIQHNVAFCTSPRKDSVWHNRAESYPFRIFPCGMFTPPLWRQAATPTTAPKLLPFSAPPADCACGVPGRPLPPCGVPEIFGDRLRRPLRKAGRTEEFRDNCSNVTTFLCQQTYITISTLHLDDNQSLKGLSLHL